MPGAERTDSQDSGLIRGAADVRASLEGLSQLPSSARENPSGSRKTLYEAPLPQPWPQNKGRMLEVVALGRPFSLAWEQQGLLQICSPDLSLAAQHLHRSCQSPELTPSLDDSRRKKKKNHAAVSASLSLERPSKFWLEGTQG